ncbi:MAG: hypothetical protein WCO23_02400 [bacterium]
MKKSEFTERIVSEEDLIRASDKIEIMRRDSSPFKGAIIEELNKAIPECKAYRNAGMAILEALGDTQDIPESFKDLAFKMRIAKNSLLRLIDTETDEQSEPLTRANCQCKTLRAGIMPSDWTEVDAIKLGSKHHPECPLRA